MDDLILRCKFRAAKDYSTKFVRLQSCRMRIVLEFDSGKGPE
jgi:hypothetical protein